MIFRYLWGPYPLSRLQEEGEASDAVRGPVATAGGQKTAAQRVDEWWLNGEHMVKNAVKNGENTLTHGEKRR